jgi:hypothetical protein
MKQVSGMEQDDPSAHCSVPGRLGLSTQAVAVGATTTMVVLTMVVNEVAAVVVEVTVGLVTTILQALERTNG